MSENEEEPRDSCFALSAELGEKWRLDSLRRLALRPVHALELRDQEVYVLERIAAGALPMHAALRVDQDRRVQLELLEVIKGRETSHIFVILVGQKSRAQRTQFR